MYKVDLHSHTIASTHAYSTIAEYAKIAKEKGILLFANTDHGPEMPDAPHPWHFANLRIIPRILDGVAIIRGVEANIKNKEGEIDCTPKMLTSIDFVVAGLHEGVCPPQDFVSNTEIVIAAISNPAVHMISHPGNPNYPLDTYAVAEAAKKYNVALEINNASFAHSRARAGSKNHCKNIAKAVKDVGGLIGLGSDSHIAYTLGDFGHALQLIKDVDFPEKNILNISPRNFLDFLESKTGKNIPEFAHL